MILHAGLIARRAGERWRGVLIDGPSGSGKSDVALRLIAAGWRLVADDRVLVWRSDGRAFGRSPEPLHGLIEARGVGVVGARSLPLAEILLVVSAGAATERVPDGETRVLADVTLPGLALNLLEPSAATKLAIALEQALAHKLGGAPAPLGDPKR